MNHKPSISDEAVFHATGRSWREWFGAMQSAGMGELPHKEIVAALRDQHGVPSWWQQSIAGAFEDFIGRRERGPDDGLEVSVNREFDFLAARAYAMWADEAERRTWLRKRDFAPAAFEPPRAVHGEWTRDGSMLEIVIEEIDEGRCRMTVHHRKLPDSETAEMMRKFWKTALERLAGKKS